MYNHKGFDLGHERIFWVKETTCAKKRGGHARNYSLKDIVESVSLTGMVSGERRIMVVALEPEEGKATFCHEVCYCIIKMIADFFFYRKWSHL